MIQSFTVVYSALCRFLERYTTYRHMCCTARRRTDLRDVVVITIWLHVDQTSRQAQQYDQLSV